MCDKDVRQRWWTKQSRYTSTRRSVYLFVRLYAFDVLSEQGKSSAASGRFHLWICIVDISLCGGKKPTIHPDTNAHQFEGDPVPLLLWLMENLLWRAEKLIVRDWNLRTQARQTVRKEQAALAYGIDISRILISLQFVCKGGLRKSRSASLWIYW